MGCEEKCTDFPIFKFKFKKNLNSVVRASEFCVAFDVSAKVNYGFT